MVKAKETETNSKSKNRSLLSPCPKKIAGKRYHSSFLKINSTNFHCRIILEKSFENQKD